MKRLRWLRAHSSSVSEKIWIDDIAEIFDPARELRGRGFLWLIIQKIIDFALVKIGAGLNLTDWVRINIMGSVK